MKIRITHDRAHESLSVGTILEVYGFDGKRYTAGDDTNEYIIHKDYCNEHRPDGTAEPIKSREKKPAKEKIPDYYCTDCNKRLIVNNVLENQVFKIKENPDKTWCETCAKKYSDWSVVLDLSAMEKMTGELLTPEQITELENRGYTVQTVERPNRRQQRAKRIKANREQKMTVDERFEVIQQLIEGLADEVRTLDERMKQMKEA